MNPNYMNMFDPSIPGGGMPMGNAYGNQPGFPDMRTGGSFMDMINGPGMMPPGQPPVQRFNPYGMYGHSPYGMENSAARLQQFARQMSPRPNTLNLAGQSMQDQMAMYNMQQQMNRMRMKQLPPNYNPHRYSQPHSQPHMPPWSRMPSSMPHLQQQTSVRNSVEVLQSSMQSNIQPLHAQDDSSSSFRKMPVLDEAPPVIRGQSPLMPQAASPLMPQTAQRPQQPGGYETPYMNRMYSDNASNLGSPSYNPTPGQQQLSLNLNNDGLNLPGVSYPSPQQRPTHSGQPPQGTNSHAFPSATDFFGNFNTNLNNAPSPKVKNPSVPQSPKLTHFGPSTPSSVSSFDQNTTPFETATTTTTTTSTTVTTAPTLTTTASTFMPTTTSIMSSSFPARPSPSSLSLAASAKTKYDEQLKNAANHGLLPLQQNQTNMQQYLFQMKQIQQQIAKLKQLPNSPQVHDNINILTQQYQSICREYEIVKQNVPSTLPHQNLSMNAPQTMPSMQQPPPLQQHQQGPRNIPPLANIQQQVAAMPSLRSQDSTQLPPRYPPAGQPSLSLPPNSSQISLPPNSSQPNSTVIANDTILNTNSLDIPDIGNFETKGSFLNEQRNENLFPNELFSGSLLFAGDSLSDVKLDNEKKITPDPGVSQSSLGTTIVETVDEKKSSPPLPNLDNSVTKLPINVTIQNKVAPSPILTTSQSQQTSKTVPVSQSLSQTVFESNMNQLLQQFQPLRPRTDIQPMWPPSARPPPARPPPIQHPPIQHSEGQKFRHLQPIRPSNERPQYQPRHQTRPVEIQPYQPRQPRPRGDMQQQFQPLLPKDPTNQAQAQGQPFLPFPFHHPRFAPQQNLMMPHNMMSVSDLIASSSTSSSTPGISTSGNVTGYSSLPGASSLHANFQLPIQPSVPAPSQTEGQIEPSEQTSLPVVDVPKAKPGRGRGRGVRGSRGGKGSGRGRAGRPPGSLNKKKKDEKVKKQVELDEEDADFDHLPPNKRLVDPDGPEVRRKLRDTKRKNYKDDYNYNFSDDEDKDGAKKEEVEQEPEPVNTAPEPVISGGVNALVAYQPNLEAEGEIAVIEKILAMRNAQSDEPVAEGEQPKMVEEFFVKYKAYSYLHCEWGSIEKLTKKDKRTPAKVKRYLQKRDQSYAFLNELDDEPFNPDYLEIDRVLDMQTTTDPVSKESFNHYLVKWRALPYEESTWELQMNIDEAIIQQFHELKKPPPPHLRRFVSRPHENEWRKYNESPLYKNKNRLHDYQLEGLNWLTFCWFKRINCILADEMGLGKTIQSISLLCAIKQYGIRGPFLVIAPLSTIANWQREFENWTDINAIVYHGSALSRNNIQQYEMYYKDEKGEFITSIYKFEAIITTYEMVLSANSFLCTIPFRCLILDEAHRLKNQKCKLMEGLSNLRMEHRVLLTGTPLQNNVEELYSLLNFLEPGRFPSQQVFLQEFGNLRTESQVEKLQQILKPMMLRRLKEDVATNIAAKEETIVEVELTTIQKKFYRAIIEKNFTFLAKGNNYSNLPNLMNTMMELRKCCNHPFLIKGAEDRILSEYVTSAEDPDKEAKLVKAMIESSGKLVLIDKLLPKLKVGGHKVLIFSQMIKVLNIIEDYLVAKRYLFERIDGGVQGSMRQAAIDRFCRPDSDRFVFLLCTRAGGLGINLTAADTVIIFDSDWNPQNDLQAQARCHRIGQEKPVKVYRLICRNTYEREMFDRASLKLGLDKAVLQNMNAKDSSSGQQAMSKKEVEELLKKGAYGAVMETDEDANKFCEEDIDQILSRRTQIVQIQGEGKGSTFSKASFVSDKARQDINLDDPDFWQKWARKASLDVNELEKDQELIVDEPRKRKQTKRFGNDGDPSIDMSDFDSDDETYEPHKEKEGKKTSFKSYGPIERAAWTRVECFKVEKGLLTYGWSRWREMISQAHFRQEVRHSDVEAISRTILAFCYHFSKADDRTKAFFVDLIDTSIAKAPPKNSKFDITDQILGSASPRGTRGRKGKIGKNALRRLTHQYSKPALIECTADWLNVSPELMIIDAGYRKHLIHHCSRIMGRVRLMHCLQYDIFKDVHDDIFDGKKFDEIKFELPLADVDSVPTTWWDGAADRSLLIGTYKHGYEMYRQIRNDEALCFYHKLGPLQFIENEKTPGSPDSINPSSVERQDDASDPEFTVSKRKSRMKKDEDDDDDSLIESDEEKELFSSLNNSPASNKEINTDKDKESSSEFRWPLLADLNLRLRRLFGAYLKLSEKEYLDIVKAEKDKQKQERLAVIALERQKKKVELQQKWTKREEADFYRVISNFGVFYNRETKVYDWEKFKIAAKLDKKHTNTLTAYYNEFMAMCRKVTGKSTDEDLRKYKGSQLEIVSEERATRCLQRIRLLSRIREQENETSQDIDVKYQVLPHEKLAERLALCQLSPEFPRWWEKVKHDKALLEGVSKHGLYRTEYHVLLDPDLIFKQVVEKASKRRLKTEVKLEDEGDVEMKPVNGEHSDDTLSKLDNPNEIKTEDSSARVALPVMTDDYAHLLASWPKDKALVSHLEKVCQCVIKGEWSKPTRFDITPIVAKLPASSRSVIGTVGQMTRNHLTSDTPGVRGDEAASRDFKIKSIDGLKLTVQSSEATKKRRRAEDDGRVIVSPIVKKGFERIEREESGEIKKKKTDSVNIVEVHRSSSNVQIHVPKSTSIKSPTSHSGSKQIIHFPANVRVPKVSSSVKITVPTITSPTKIRVHPSVMSSDKDMKSESERLSQKSTSKESPKLHTHDQPVGIHIDSPNSNVRIVGSRIEVKEKSSAKREIDLSEVILKVPDPSKFLPHKKESVNVKEKHVPTKEVAKKRSKPPSKTSVKSPTFEKLPPELEKSVKTNNSSSSRKIEIQRKEKGGSTQVESTRSRPERSAKKKAKDSISEMSEVEQMSFQRALVAAQKQDDKLLSRSPPHWAEIRSPTRAHKSSHDIYHYDYYTERKHSPTSHRRHLTRSPPTLRRLSPDRHSPPPSRTYHSRPLSPIHNRHSRSPPAHELPIHLREFESEHMKHLYTEPLSPRHRGRDIYFSERSRSPLYYHEHYMRDKELAYPELERLSPTFKKLTRHSPSKDLLSPVHKHDTYPFVHLSDSISPRTTHHRRELHSPVNSDERFPYGRIVDYDSARYKHSEVNSRSGSIRSSPIEGAYQYQPLSRESKSKTRKPSRSTSPELGNKHTKSTSKHSSSESLYSLPERQHPNSDNKSKKRDFVNSKNPPTSSINPPLSFYPVDSKGGKEVKRNKSLSVERGVIEIPEKAKTSKSPQTKERAIIEIPENVKPLSTNVERKLSQKRKGGLGLLEMKIQGLKKQKLDEGSKDMSKKPSNQSSVQPTSKSQKTPRNISTVINNLSNAVRTSVISPPPTKSGGDLAKKKPNSRTKKTLSLDAIAQNLTDRASALSPPGSAISSPISPTFDKKPHIPRTVKPTPVVRSPVNLADLRTIQRTPDPGLRESCISPTEQTSPLRRVTNVTTATTGRILSPVASSNPTAVSPSSRTRRSLDELVNRLSTSSKDSAKKFAHDNIVKSPLEGKRSLGFLDRKIEELREKSLNSSSNSQSDQQRTTKSQDVKSKTFSPPKLVRDTISKVASENVIKESKASDIKVDSESAIKESKTSDIKVVTESVKKESKASDIISKVTSESVIKESKANSTKATNSTSNITLTEPKSSLDVGKQRSSVISPVPIIDGPPPNVARPIQVKTPKTLTVNTDIPIVDGVMSPNTEERLLDEKASEIVNTALHNIKKDERLLTNSRPSVISPDTPFKAVIKQVPINRNIDRSPPVGS